jgi:outer membrane protein TolC
MNLLVLASAVLIAVANEQVGPTLTFDEAVGLARTRSAASTTEPLLSDIAGLRRSRLPSVRAEVTGNTSRTLDLFSEGPLQVRFASSVLAFDYPLWDGGATNARINTVEAKLRRVAAQSEMDDGRFTQLLDAFGELYLAQRQSEDLHPLLDRLSAGANQLARLLSEGEISNLAAMERRENVLALQSRLLDLEARRIDAASRLRILTGVEAEPRLVLDPSEPVAAEVVSDKLLDDYVKATTIAVDESRARLREVNASSGFRAMLSGFAGVGTAESDFRHVSSNGSFGVYGLRLNLSYPLLGGTGAIAIAEARADVAQSVAMRDAAIRAARARASEYQIREETARKRIDLLRRSLEVASEREQALARLITGGLRSEGDLELAEADRIRRQADLLAAEIERWKAARLLARMTMAGTPGQP